MIHIVDNSKYALSGFKNKYYRTNGMSFEEYFSRSLKKGCRKEGYILAYNHVIWFYGRTKNTGKTYQYSNKGIVQFFSNLLNEKDIATIKRAWNFLEELGLIKRKVNKDCRREIYYDEEVAYKLMNIYEPEHDIFITNYANEMAVKNIMDGSTKLTSEEYQKLGFYEQRRYDRLAKRYGHLSDSEREEAFKVLVDKYIKALKKIVSKRLLSYVEHASDKCSEYKEGKVENKKYSNANEMLIYFIHDVAGMYSDVSNLFKKFTPQNLMDEQDLIDQELKHSRPMKRLSKEDIVRIRTMSIPKAKKYVKSLIGWFIPEGYEEQALSAGILFTDDGMIKGFDYIRRKFNVII